MVNHAGSGTGIVTSDPGGIECSNVGGGPAGPDCSEIFPTVGPSFEPNVIELGATAGTGSYFAGWSGDDPNLLGLATCNSGSENPCEIVDTAEFFANPPVHITATFEPLPDPPGVATGASAPGANEDLLALEGMVNPQGAEVKDCHIEYGPTVKYGLIAPCAQSATEIGEGMTDVPVTGEAELEQLKPNTVYHYRLVASTVGGESSGEDRTFTTDPPPVDDCPNGDFRDAQPFGLIRLPGCMALEQATPSQKANQPANEPAISADGERVLFRTAAGLAGTPGNINPGGGLYVAIRNNSGWTSFATAQAGIFKGWDPNADPQSFKPNFDCWFQLGATRSQDEVGTGRIYQGCLGGLFTPLSPLLVPLGEGTPNVVRESRFSGAAADHSRVYFTPGGSDGASINTAYLAGDPKPDFVSGAEPNTYAAHLDSSQGVSLELLARDRDGKAWGEECGARLGGVKTSDTAFGVGRRDQGSVSTDGSRTYLSTRPSQPPVEQCDSAKNKLRILERLESAQGPWIGHLLPNEGVGECARVSPPCDSADSNDFFQGASTDGTKVYFTTSRQLADSDVDGVSECVGFFGLIGCDLYLYDSTRPGGERLIQVSAGEDNAVHETGDSAQVFDGITSISSDGTRAYFVAAGVLTEDPNPEGVVAAIGQPNLYVWDEEAESINFIGQLDFGDDSSGLWGGSGVLVFGGADGRLLIFNSRAALTDADVDGSRRDIYRYDAESEQLLCISCRPGGPDSEPFDANSGVVSARRLGTDFAEQNRIVSDDGESILIETGESLVPGDVNESSDTYLWREGQFYRLPGTNGLTAEPTLSQNGSEVAFVTPVRLLPSDGDTATDVYVAREGGGFPHVKPSIPCQPDESLPGPHCRGIVDPPPPPVNPTSQNPSSGNATPRRPKCPVGKRRVVRKGKAHCVARKKSAKRRKQPSHSQRIRDANTDRRAAK